MASRLKNVNKEIPLPKLQLLHVFISLPGKAAGLNDAASDQAQECFGVDSVCQHELTTQSAALKKSLKVCQE